MSLGNTTPKRSFSLIRMLAAVILAGVLLGLTRNTPVDYRVPESIMRQRIIESGSVPDPRYYKVGAPFGAVEIKATWDAQSLTRTEEIVRIRYLAYVGNALFWLVVVIVAFFIGSQLSQWIRRLSAKKVSTAGLALDSPVVGPKNHE